MEQEPAKQPVAQAGTSGGQSEHQKNRRPGFKQKGRCFGCGKIGHMKRECPKFKKTDPVVKGEKKETGEEKSTSGQGVGSKIAPFLQGVKCLTAEFASGFAGPQIICPLEVEGTRVDALIDSGSEINIISESFFQNMALNRGKGSELLERLHDVDRKFYAYGKKEIDCFKVWLSLEVQFEEVKQLVPCIVDEGPRAEADFILGTSGMYLLGFSVGTPVSNINLIDYHVGLGSGSEEISGSSTRVTTAQSTIQTCSVYSCQSKKIPSLNSRTLLVKTGISAPKQMAESRELVFFPSPNLQEDGLCIPESVVSPDGEGQFKVEVSNYGRWPAVLPQGEIGHLELCEVVRSTGSLDYSAKADTDGGSVLQVTSEHRLLQAEKHQEEVAAKLNIGADVISEEGIQQLKRLLLCHHDQFALSDAEIGEATGVQHFIDTGEHSPHAERLRRFPPALEEEIDKKVDEWCQLGICEPSNSEWAANLVPIRKANSREIRLCVNWKPLNKVQKKDRYPLPSCVRHIDAAGARGAHIFSSLDMRSGYLQIKMDEDSMDKTQFITRKGTFRMRRMGFGLCNAPATYQRMMDALLAPLPSDKIWAYLDDVLIATVSLAEHLEVLEQFLIRLHEFGLTLHPDKCKFLRSEIKFLGFIVNSFGRQADPAKVKAIVDYPQPRTPKQLRAFLGCCSYYRVFIKGFAKIAHPLTEALKGEPHFLKWTSACQVAFNQLKQTLTEAPALAFPDISRPFVIETDGSKVGIAAVLEQMNEQNGKLQPVAFASRTLRGSEVRYGATDLEMLAVVFALKHYRTYIYGQPVTVITDHQPLAAMLRKDEELASDRQMRWKAFILGHDIEIIYRQGKKNLVCDALSRYFPSDLPSAIKDDEKIDEILGEHVLRVRVKSEDESSSVNGQSIEDDEFGLSDKCMKEIQVLQRHDQEIRDILVFKEENQLPESETMQKWLVAMDCHFEVVDGLLYYIGNPGSGNLRLVVPARERDTLLWEHHCSPSGAHMACEKVLERVTRNFYWKSLRQDVFHFCKSCIVCAARTGQSRHVKVPLKPIPPPEEPWQVVAMDIVSFGRGCYTLQGNTCCLVLTCLFSKFLVVVPMPDQKAETVVQALIDHVLPHEGLPSRFLSDRGVQFTSAVMQVLSDIFQVKQLYTTSFHPQTDGQTERCNRSLLNMLSKCCALYPYDWDKFVPYVVQGYNASIHSSSKHSPFYLMYLRQPRFPSGSVLSVPSSRYAVDLDRMQDSLPLEVKRAWKIVREELQKSKEEQKKQYDRKTKDHEFQIGDLVMVKDPGVVRKNWISPTVVLGRSLSFPLLMQLCSCSVEIRFIQKRFM